MFGISGGEFVILAVLGLLIFGPDKLPKAIQQVGSVLRQLRKMATSAKKDLQDGLGPEFKDFDVNDLNPKAFVRRHLLEDEDDSRGRPRRRSTAGLNGRRPPFDDEAT
ncbi:Sec-independent protein translocase subunit TatB [Spiractinospora alimapuensis]|uniref:sec-independent translocase n=1 Tax=Spiractinospora alimapuensis TaxID=2820884 RepID=UPI001EEAB2EF|nr:sec-independent translocase [Spiractinospora alimapuensis]QVQ51384.1 Sec-independent protein translocase subunit TatB [Spiractinospora alimapuensis]